MTLATNFSGEGAVGMAKRRGCDGFSLGASFCLDFFVTFFVKKKSKNKKTLIRPYCVWKLCVLCG
ncbi:MAG: hypothetical protein ACKVQB_13155 [Bacteroidia bacterium]